MRIDKFQKIAEFGFPQTLEDQERVHEYLRFLGVDPANLYQELEMSSPFANTHRDTTYSNASISLHSHDYYEILFCRSDGVEYLVGTERYRLQKGDIVFVPPGISHRPILPEHMPEPYVRDVLWISPVFMDQLRTLFAGDDRISLDYMGPLRTAGTRWEFLGELFRIGVQEEKEKRPGWEAAVIGNTLTIFANLKRSLTERTAATMQAEKPELLDRVTAYIEENYIQHITVSELAKYFYVSESTISHAFKEKMGISLYRYITQRRLIAAKLLIGENHPLEEVARRVGFLDYSTFYRAFKQEYGISPRQFARKQP